MFGFPFLLYKSNTLVLRLKDVVSSPAGIGGEVITASKDGFNRDWILRVLCLLRSRGGRRNSLNRSIDD